MQVVQIGDLIGRTSSNTVDFVECIRSLTRTQFRRIQYDLIIKNSLYYHTSYVKCKLCIQHAICYMPVPYIHAPTYNICISTFMNNKYIFSE